MTKRASAPVPLSYQCSTSTGEIWVLEGSSDATVCCSSFKPPWPLEILQTQKLERACTV